MSMLVKGIPVPVLAGLVVLIIGGLLHIIGLATPYWHSITNTSSQQKDVPIGHHGLWADCKNINDDQVDCTEHSDTAGFVVAVRALEVLGLLCGIACMIVTGLWFFLDIKQHRLILMISCLGSGFLSGLFGLIGIIIYAAEINSQDRTSTTLGQRTETSLSWSFTMCVFSSCLAIVAVILFAIGTRMRT